MNSNKTMTIRKRFIPAAALLVAFASAASAQQIPFTMEYAQGAITTPVANNSILTLAAPLGLSQTLQIRAIHNCFHHPF